MEYLKVWTSFREVIRPLTDAEKGRLFVMMLQYAETGDEPADFEGNERFLWIAAKQDIDRTFARNETLRLNGLKGGRPKATQTNTNQDKPTETNTNQSEAKESCNIKKCNIKKNNKDISFAFDLFWNAYPRHVNKQAAMKAFDKAGIDNDLLKTILAAIDRQKQSEQWTKDNGQFIPHPATWLNGRRWEDEDQPVNIKVLPAQKYDQRDYTGVQNQIEDAQRKRIADRMKGAQA